MEQIQVSLAVLKNLFIVYQTIPMGFMDHLCSYTIHLIVDLVDRVSQLSNERVNGRYSAILR